MNNTKTKKGFTLIEILIVVSIIGLLASVIFVGLAGTRARGRDARRVADLRSIQTGLELYFSKNGSYPATLDALRTASIGVTNIPKDPSTGANYGYGVASPANSYVLIADTEASAGDAIYSSSIKPAELSGTYGSVSVADCGTGSYCVSF